MGRLIDADVLDKHMELYTGTMIETYDARAMIDDTPTVEAIPKADYETRLKADLVAMLEDIKKEIIELPFPQREPEYMQGYSYCQMNILDYVIQEKINELKAESENKDDKTGSN